ncbi:MAG: hypothetical protein PHU61_04480 [Candidatus Absconditabacteria bacterium]|nr:hypothetical protein [Candidatus Absconditabacteria bacterium]MDD3868734.1 hypothetical protein [Candidatus Absconditabacteria bacterium]MDD4714767.1 hypothetical protein [Candidatus Absconditabacteria bacterium]
MTSKHKEYRDRIISLAGRGEVIEAINHLERFSGMSHREIISLFLDCGAGQEIEKNLYKFSNLTAETVKHLIKRGVANTVRQYLDSFAPSDHEHIKTLLIEHGYADTVVQR